MAQDRHSAAAQDGGLRRGKASGRSSQPPVNRGAGQESAAASLDGVRMTGRLKWYKPTKGFGFVSFDPPHGDALLHGSVLEQAGLRTVEPDSIVVCEVAQGPRGATVTRIESVDASTARTRPAMADAGPVEETVRAAVKWFDQVKGFGFLAAEQGPDIFVHASVLAASKIDTLYENEHYLVGFANGPKGRVAITLEPTA